MTETALILPISLFVGMLVCQVILSDRLTCSIGRQILTNRAMVLAERDYSHSADPITDYINDICQLTSPVSIQIVEPKNVTQTECNGIPIITQTPDNDIFSAIHIYRNKYSRQIGDTEIIIMAYYDLTEIPYHIYFLIRIIFIISIVTPFAILIIFGIHSARIANEDSRDFENSNITSKNTLIHICDENEFRDNMIREATRLKRHGGYLSVAAVQIANQADISRIYDRDIAAMIDRSVLQSIIDNIRIFDIVGKFTDDTRVYICMIDSSESDSIIVASRFASTIRDTKFFIDGHEEINIDINGGVAGIHIDKDDPTLPAVTFGESDCQRLIANARDALANAEAQGSPCIKTFDDPE